jgi:hypothetical protein
MGWRARSGTDASELNRFDEAYFDVLDALVEAYEDAADASRTGNDEALNRALDVAEPADDEFNGIVARNGLTACALPLGEPGDEGVSQSGFPAMFVPEEAFLGSPPSEDGELGQIVYPIGDDAALVLYRGPAIDTGTVSVDEAAEYLEADPPFGHVLGDSAAAGNRLVDMRRYDFTNDRHQVSGDLYASSGQGHVYVLECSSRPASDAEAELEAACQRAVETLGFLMF